MEIAVIIPFRDRGIDPRRAANLDVVQAWWYAHGFTPQIVDDGLSGDAQFNRHRAYNRAVSGNAKADVFVFAEADILLPPDQVFAACFDAIKSPGLVVPFTQYRYLGDERTAYLRDQYHDMDPKALAAWWTQPMSSRGSVFTYAPDSIMDDGKSIGAVNVVSRETLDITGGFTEMTSGNWYDDNIIEAAFAYLTGHKTRWVRGPAVHLYHLPGWKGDHLTDADREATYRNKLLLEQVHRFIRLGNRLGVRTLMASRDLTAERR